jgi:hypothetical protein
MVRTINQHPIYLFFLFWVRRGRDRMVYVVEFTTTSTIITKCMSWKSAHGEVHSIQYYVIKFVSDL